MTSSIYKQCNADEQSSWANNNLSIVFAPTLMWQRRHLCERRLRDCASYLRELVTHPTLRYYFLALPVVEPELSLPWSQGS